MARTNPQYWADYRYHWDEYFHIYIESKIDDSILFEKDSNLAENATGLGMIFVLMKRETDKKSNDAK